MRLTPAVMRALDILELFHVRREWTLNDAVGATEIPRTSAHEIMNTLAQRGYLERSAVGTYRLGSRTAQLGHSFASSFDILGAASETVRRLADRTGLTSSVAVRDGTSVFYLAKVDGQEPLSLISSVGRRAPASCTGLGKVLLAQLDDQEIRFLYRNEGLPVLTERSLSSVKALLKELADIRKRGYATELGESGPHVGCIAAPIHDAGGQVIAAISLSLPLDRWSESSEQHWASMVLESAHELSGQLGHTGESSPPRHGDNDHH